MALFNLIRSTKYRETWIRYEYKRCPPINASASHGHTKDELFNLALRNIIIEIGAYD